MKKGKIELIIEEKEAIEESIAEKFEQTINDDDMVVTVKWNIVNIIDEEGSLESVSEEDALAHARVHFPVLEINNYLAHCGMKVKYSCLGVHLNGKKLIPHIHYHLIVEPFNFTGKSNPSTHRKRFRESHGISHTGYFSKISIGKIEPVDKSKPAYSTLAYTLKEGLHLRDWFPQCYHNIDNKSFNFLKDVGQSIYEKELGLKLRQDKCEERKQNALLELFVLCDKNKDKFSSYKQMLLWLDKNYIANLSVTEYPDPKNYKTNCQKVAVQLGFITYSSLCL